MTMSNVLLGLATGIPVMIVIGPIALLLIDQGMEHGVRGAMPAVIGVAVTDLSFAALAASVGAAAAGVLEPFEGVLRVAAVGILVLLALRLWRQARVERAMARRRCDAPELVGAAARSGSFDADAAPVRVDAIERGDAVQGGSAGPLARAFGFFALTAVNPITIAVFASIVVAGGEGTGSAGWVFGMVLASMIVSVAFVSLGHGLGAVLDDAATATIRMAGAVLIVVMAAHFALG